MAQMQIANVEDMLFHGRVGGIRSNMRKEGNASQFSDLTKFINCDVREILIG
jgi:hypothetical protein